ncbi:MAG: HD family phosphohydrolase [Clostridium sp.]|nr:HDIG domain-containing protein [Clostridium sp.]
MDSKTRGKKINVIRDKSQRMLILTLTFVVTYFLIIVAISPKKYDLKSGDIAQSDIKAPRETVDEVASQEVLDEALKKVDKQYTQKSEVKTNVENQVKDLFQKIIELTSSQKDIKNKVKELTSYKNFSLSEHDATTLLSLNRDTLKNLQWEILDILNTVYETNIQDGNEESLLAAQQTANSEMDKLNLDSSYESIIRNIVLSKIEPNLFYDEEKTNEKIEEVKKSTEKVIIKKNQIIVKEGEPITEGQIQTLKELGIIGEGKTGSLLVLYILTAMFIGIILYLQYTYVKKNHKAIYEDNKKLILICLLNVSYLVLASGVKYVSPYLIPMVCTPLLLSMLINHKVSLVLSSYNVILLGALIEFDPQIILLAFISTILSSTILRKMQQRNDIIYATLGIGLLCGILNFLIGNMVSINIKEVIINSLLTIVGVLISGILTIGILPFIENTFDVVTTLKLLELSNPNSPLLRKLLMESPGTYHHSMLVANLAEMAAEEVGANPVVTRIGAYYHDVGKTSRPYFFKENQIGNENPHDKITAALSARIIISHVKDGVELAKEYKLPKVIQDIIAEHHGTTFVKYFYITEKNNSDDPDSINEDDYKYPGPIPSTKESGIIMLADSVEAAVRSITEPTSEKIEQMVSNIIDGKIKDKQLNNCDLTFKDLDKIKECFLKALKGIYHQRIEYPTEKIRTVKKEENK